MSLYNRPRRHRNSGTSAVGYHLRQRRRRFEEQLAPRAGGPPSGLLSDAEFLIDTYYSLRAVGGHAPGPDGVTYDSIGPTEVAIVLREAAGAVRRGDFRPGPGRKLAIPKTGGGTRTLTIANVVDRVMAAAVARALTPYFEQVFLPSSYGFRPGLGAQDLLADLMAAMAALQITTLAIDDVKKAFDFVPIAPLMETFAEHIVDRSLLQLVEVVLRGGEDRDRAVGIPQGSPLSPLALNVYLHHAHDLPLEADVTFPPFFRYADNLMYLAEGVPEGQKTLDRVRQLLAHAGLALKGADGPPIDLREGGGARLLGFRLSMHGDRLRLNLGEDALEEDMAGYLIEAHDDPDPHRAARTALRGWVASYGPALGELTDTDVGEILHASVQHGFRELASREELEGWCTASHARWTGRYATALGRVGLGGEDDLFAATPPATVEPGD